MISAVASLNIASPFKIVITRFGIFTFSADLSQVAGPVGIAGAVGSASMQGFGSLFSIMAIISINLFVLNLLPVPVLDGGHLVFYTIEAIKGAPLSMRKMEIAQQVGMVLLLGLMVFAIFNDITRLWFK